MPRNKKTEYPKFISRKLTSIEKQIVMAGLDTAHELIKQMMPEDLFTPVVGLLQIAADKRNEMVREGLICFSSDKVPDHHRESFHNLVDAYLKQEFLMREEED